MPSPEAFYLHLSGEQRGPYTVPQIDHLLHSGLIAEETLYWREGLEQWQPVTELVPLRRPPRHWKRFAAGGAILVPLALLLWIFGPPLADGWREATSNRFTFEDAYWRARDAVRQQPLPWGSLLSFETFSTAGVELHKNEAAQVVLRGQIAPREGPPRATIWRVQLPYDRTRGEWTISAAKIDTSPQ